MDESFKKPGCVPFKWEEKPGVPKSQLDHNHPSVLDHHHSLPTTPRRLAPPPSSAYFTPPSDLGSHLLRSATSSQSGCHRLDPKPRSGPVLAHPLVVSAGCLLSPFFRRKWGRKKKVAHKASPEHEPDCVPDSPKATLFPQRSLSTRKSMSLWEFPVSSFSSSRRSSSSPRAGRDPEWAGFGLV